MLIPVVLSGGAGTRLWPVSRKGHPKPFMALADGQSLLNKTYQRAEQVTKPYGCSPIYTVTNQDYFFLSKDQFTLAQTEKQRSGMFLLEPVSRNTAAAIAMAAFTIRHQHGADAVMLVLPADHLIEKSHNFSEAVGSAYALALQEYLVTFGIVPSAPEEGFGYMESGDPLGSKAYAVKQFVEKPNKEKAQAYLESGSYYWNSGMFCFKSGSFLDALEQHQPDIYKNVAACWAQSVLSLSSQSVQFDADTFMSIADISVDYAVMEKADNVAVVPCDLGWSDIGSWKAVSELTPADENNNRVVGEAVVLESSNVYVESRERVVAVLGLENVMVVDTPDAVLVMNDSHTQKVKDIVGVLKSTNHDSYRLHKTANRPWGTYTVLEETAGYKIKRIEVKPSASLSLQSHQHRSEHWIVVSGTAQVVNGDLTLTINKNESTYIPAGHVHRLTNISNETLVLIEVQTGSYLGEDDIVRYDDKYGRV